MGINFDLATIWAFIIAFAVFMYVVMDGFDLGIGILFPTFQRGDERSQAMNAIAPASINWGFGWMNAAASPSNNSVKPW